MDPKELITYIESPHSLDENSINEVTILAEDYPYFQTAQLLRVKNIHNIAAEYSRPALNFAAAFTADRKILYYLLHPVEVAKEIEPAPTPSVETDSLSSHTTSPEKDIKDTLEENISDTLNNQIEFIEETPKDLELKAGLILDINKEYGQGFETEEYVFRLQNLEEEALEFIEEAKDEIEELSESSQPNEGSLDSFDGWLDQVDQIEKHPTKPDIKKDVPALESKLKDSEQKLTDDLMNLIQKGAPIEDIDKLDESALNEKQKSHNNLIDRFIQTNPKIIPEVSKFESGDISKSSVSEQDNYITETLAQIYKRQGNYAKALFAYEKLSLKYPEKSTYFAGQIAEIKKLIEKPK